MLSFLFFLFFLFLLVYLSSSEESYSLLALLFLYLLLSRSLRFTLLCRLPSSFVEHALSLSLSLLLLLLLLLDSYFRFRLFDFFLLLRLRLLRRPFFLFLVVSLSLLRSWLVLLSELSTSSSLSTAPAMRATTCPLNPVVRANFSCSAEIFFRFWDVMTSRSDANLRRYSSSSFSFFRWENYRIATVAPTCTHRIYAYNIFKRMGKKVRKRNWKKRSVSGLTKSKRRESILTQTHYLTKSSNVRVLYTWYKFCI